ncbi:alpha/beta hydrolase [Paraliomyxa miuraensis]|uniref:alpha/beta hydrolase n=1 Tax=Paraliomyxa miuraensis TaxID=376150 RepID=UPI002252B475|nr:alpha/beta hydrolase-fold protein [Paraliomyxa miuraensis]MCX4244782.1 alpha/beta hydrolase-fold protein [Paraliomyxa miuraensis]
MSACAPKPAPAAAPVLPTSSSKETLEPLVIGQTWTIDSQVLDETRRINVLVPTIYGEAIDEPLPVLYVLDGGIYEDFLHVAGLVQVLVSNGSMRPRIVVGIENTERRRDMTGPTTNPDDLAIAPVVGGSASFRGFFADELMPAVARRHRVTGEAAIVGESLAGLFVVETLLLRPELFDAYIAVDPSLWWADRALLGSAEAHLGEHVLRGKSLFIASGSEPELATLASSLVETLSGHTRDGLTVRYEPMPEQTHATIFHPAALRAFVAMLGPVPSDANEGPSE